MRPAAACLAALLLASCAGGATSPNGYVSADAYDGSAIALVLGTPFYAVAKATTCVTSALLGTAASAAVELTDRPAKEVQRATVHEGIGMNCRGPYYLRPAY